jgi:uncharacterized protein YaiL (DUF2058 family)
MKIFVISRWSWRMKHEEEKWKSKWIDKIVKRKSNLEKVQISCLRKLRKIIKWVCAQSDKTNVNESQNVFENFSNQKTKILIKRKRINVIVVDVKRNFMKSNLISRISN